MRRSWAVVVNVFVPGAGLIVLRREWLGFALALLFCILAQIGIVGRWLIPATVPRPMVAAGFVGACAVWLWAQWLMVHRIRTATGATVANELALLGRRSTEAVAGDELAEARDLLLAALTINDEDAQINRQWAELMTLMKRPDEAAAAWRRVLRLQPDGELGRAADQALAALSTRRD